MSDDAAPSSGRRAVLANLVKQDCGSCHGLRLEGGPGEPLTPAALEGKSFEALGDTILYGQSGTAMPPWNPFMTTGEAGWIEGGRKNCHQLWQTQ